MTQFQENTQTEKKDRKGWKDRQTLFYRILLATSRGPIKIHTYFTDLENISYSTTHVSEAKV